MNRTKQIFLLLTTLLLAGVLTLLRQWQLNTAFDTEGIPLPHAPAIPALIAAVAFAALIWLLFCLALPAGATIPAQRNYLAAIPMLTGALLIACNCGATLHPHLARESLPGILIDFTGIVAALCLSVAAILRIQGRPLHPGMRIPPYLFLMLRLVEDFRSWSIHPIVWDYCFRHFALIFSFCGLYTLTSLSFSLGRRRLTTFFAMGAVCFCAMALPQIAPTEQLLYFGLCLVMLGVLIQLTVPEKET